MDDHWLPQRMRVLNLFLRDGPLTTTEAAERLQLKVPACWNHIRDLFTDGLLQVVSRGRMRWRMQIRVYDVVGRVSR